MVLVVIILIRERKKEERREGQSTTKGDLPSFTGKKEIKSNHIKHRSKNEKRTLRVPREPREYCLLLVRKRTPLLCVTKTPKLLLFAKFASLSI
jgi:hypothetical protein